MPRSNLITKGIVRDFETLKEDWRLDASKYHDFWNPLVDAEQELLDWVFRWIERIGSEVPAFHSVCRDESRFADVRNAMLEVFLAGMWFGERRWTLKENDVFADLRRQIKEIANESS